MARYSSNVIDELHQLSQFFKFPNIFHPHNLISEMVTFINKFIWNWKMEVSIGLNIKFNKINNFHILSLLFWISSKKLLFTNYVRWVINGFIKLWKKLLLIARYYIIKWINWYLLSFYLPLVFDLEQLRTCCSFLFNLVLSNCLCLYFMQSIYH